MMNESTTILELKTLLVFHDERKTESNRAMRIEKVKMGSQHLTLSDQKLFHNFRIRYS